MVQKKNNSNKKSNKIKLSFHIIGLQRAAAVFLHQVSAEILSKDMLD